MKLACGTVVSNKDREFVRKMLEVSIQGRSRSVHAVLDKVDNIFPVKCKLIGLLLVPIL